MSPIGSLRRCIFGALALLAAGANAQSPLALMPAPSSVQRGAGATRVDTGFTIQLDGYTEARLTKAQERFYAVLSRRTGITTWNSAHPSAILHVRVTAPSAPVQQSVEDESYRLTLDAHGGILTAANPLGALHGLQTVLQLVDSGPDGFYLPVVDIADTPRFPWRGLMLDTSRHFMPIDLIERQLDGMEAVKLNVFHWHLSDDQGFRAEIEGLPLLTERGSDGLFYTQAQMRSIVAYARDRGIRVIPEIDMPGHTTALLAAYPGIGSSKASYAIERKWGIFNPALDPTQEATYKLIDRIVAELSSIFPDAYFHIGGDECTGKEWQANPAIQAFMREHNIQTSEALQAYFSSRVQKLVAAHGKIAVGWDEILQPGISPNVVIQSWHGAKAVAEAAGSGHKVILSKGYYLDLNLPAASHYAIDPLAAEASALTARQQDNVLGGEAAMWSEYVSTETVESRIWPRAAAIAERLWSPPLATADAAAMYRRLAIVSRGLEDYGLQHNSAYPRMLQRIAANESADPLRTLGDVEQPPRQHERAHLGSYDAFTPLNRMVDAIPPESSLAREFSLLCDHILAGSATSAERTRARTLLLAWQQNDARLEPLTHTALADDLAPASKALSEAAAIGLAALDALENKQPNTAAWQAEAAKHLAEDAKYHAAMSLAIVEPIAQLVKASAKR